MTYEKAATSSTIPSDVELHIPYEVSARLAHLCKEHSIEWTLIGATEKIGHKKFMLMDFIIPEQKNTSATTDVEAVEWTRCINEDCAELVEKGVYDYSKSIRDNRGTPIEEWPNEFVSKFNCWIHSHHSMGVFWSGTDYAQMKSQENGNYMISLVVSYRNNRVEYKAAYNLYNPAHVNFDMKVVVQQPEVSYNDIIQIFAPGEKMNPFQVYEKIIDQAQAPYQQALEAEYEKLKSKEVKTVYQQKSIGFTGHNYYYGGQKKNQTLWNDWYEGDIEEEIEKTEKKNEKKNEIYEELEDFCADLVTVADDLYVEGRLESLSPDAADISDFNDFLDFVEEGVVSYYEDQKLYIKTIDDFKRLIVNQFGGRKALILSLYNEWK